MIYLRCLIPYLKVYKKKLFLGFLVIAMSAIFTNLIPLVISKAVDDIKAHLAYGLLWQYASLTVLLALISGFFLFLTRQTIIIVSREIENDLRNDFLGHILIQDMRYFHYHPTGEIMALATNDISAVRNFLGPGIMYTSETIVNFILAISFMISLNFELTLVAVLPIPLISYAVYKIGKSINHKFELVQEQFSVLTTKAQENLSGIKVVKAYVRENSEIESFRRLSLDYMKKNLKLAKVQSFSFPMMFLLTGFSVMIVLFVGGNKIINEVMTIGELTAFIIYLGLLTWPIISLGWIINLTQRAEASMKRLCEVFDNRPSIEDSSSITNSIIPIKGEIEFKNVNFRYSKELPFVLKDINLKINSGETLGIIGHTGSGKTTLVNLIPRLFEVKEGELLIGGKDIKTFPFKSLRTSIGYVPQETFLFSETIENNIAYSEQNFEKDKVIQASQISQIYKDVDNFPKRFETLLGERGINLSGGQKQRTSIARAILADPKILILDDAFSAVDTYTEEEILNGLKEIMERRTAILISHRVSTLKNSDRIIVLSDGMIAETGSHESLIQQEGIYADIYFKQLLEEELKEL
ncbi:MAG: ABC transporter ATP-binding protein/permease [Chlorobi bacterium]|nr:ABC transporter ATP-binding protein/permease [Chlorobiota bacterium]MCI0716059.1 ABC transporter ATP-binding protein/permease [Chlorobiota bacterium]